MHYSINKIPKTANIAVENCIPLPNVAPQAADIFPAQTITQEQLVQAYIPRVTMLHPAVHSMLASKQLAILTPANLNANKAAGATVQLVQNVLQIQTPTAEEKQPLQNVNVTAATLFGT